ncbi:hypothetical protein RRG08_026488 [Elysia crispata]|uniref:Uncharacterized protein n=1 Tax=Elysia crispata TaxID=231223 RepID=A0AAE1CSA4_9GAST|nr:hypothetical protein RRG08_026488 [Elysia crispata]
MIRGNSHWSVGRPCHANSHRYTQGSFIAFSAHLALIRRINNLSSHKRVQESAREASDVEVYHPLMSHDSRRKEILHPSCSEHQISEQPPSTPQ